MSAVDFSEWAAPDLVLKNLGANAEGVGGHTINVCPPTVDNMRKVLALAAKAEIEVGWFGDIEVPQGVAEVLESIKPDEHPALGSAFDAMKAVGISDGTINRAAFYAIFYWARGKTYADAFATLLWAPRDPASGKAGASGDAPRKG